jgi:DNA-binding transcriptional regulator YhcF (GntR family)
MNFKENQPIYLQLAEGIMDRVQSGDLKTGSKIESVRETAGKNMVNINTVVRAYEWLEAREIIAQKRGIGFFITEKASQQISEMRRKEFFGGEAEYFMHRLQSFGITPDELKKMYQDYILAHQ